MTKAFKLNFSAKALFFLTSLDYKKRLPKLVRQSLVIKYYRDCYFTMNFLVSEISLPSTCTK